MITVDKDCLVLLYLNPKTVYNALPRPLKRLKPWKHTHLSKAERKGKTPQQIQQLRFEKWKSMKKEITDR